MNEISLKNVITTVRGIKRTGEFDNFQMDSRKTHSN